MAKIDIKETGEAVGPGLKQQQQQGMNSRSPSSKSPSPARRDAAPHNSNNSSADSLLSNDPSNRGGVSNESGYFEDEEEAGEVRENSIEIIFDKNATNNNVGQDGKSHNTGTAYCLL